MPQKPKQLYLSQNPRCVRDVVKDVVYLFDCYPFSCFGVNSTANDAIAALADDLLDCVSVGLSILCEELLGVHLLSAALL